jgi:hypothetical protein
MIKPPVVSFAVYEKSTVFDVNSSLIQYPDYNCSNLFDYNQIITNVISVNSNLEIKTNSNFVKTLFRTISVRDKHLVKIRKMKSKFLIRNF